jgi:7-cyano-7-deazaguanine synthase
MWGAGVQNAIVLLSGGLDSTTCLAIAHSQGFACHTLTVQYGQRHQVEIAAAATIAHAQGAVEHRLFPLDLRFFGGSALTDPAIAVPLDRTLETHDVPATYVPARNTIFLSLALAWAEVLPADHIFIGVSAVDYSGYPDCRADFITSFERTANLACARWAEGAQHLCIHAPLQNLSKADTIRAGRALGVDYALTHSCYQPDPAGRACGHCDSCWLRRRAFHEAGTPDPTRYAAEGGDTP